MNESLNQFRNQIFGFLSTLSTRQKIVIFSGFAIGLAIILLMMVWTNSPRYEVLFSQLSQKDAGQIIEKLRDQKVQYRLENGGTTIMVPSSRVYELRLDFAREGIPQNSMVGYEIFDKSNLGMTDFIQKVNYKRAMEGELTRTIEQIESVDKARVHIVIPEESLFREDQEKTTASVILKLRGAGNINTGHVQGIVHLLASSVEGLQPENITIVDSRGRMLSDQKNPDDLLTMSTTQLDFKKRVEDYLAQKAQTLLDRVVGPGNAVVRTTAELNFKRVEKTIEEYDPDNTAIRSEEIQEQVTPVSGENLNESARTSNTVTNYEVNKSVQHVVEDFGNITHLSLAVLVNNKKEKITAPDGTETVQSVPRTPEELNMLADLVKKAVGYRQGRNDEFSIQNVNFNLPDLEETAFPAGEQNQWMKYYPVLEKIFIFLAIIVSMIIIRSLFGQVRKRNETLQGQLKYLHQQAQMKQLMAGSGPQSELYLTSGEQNQGGNEASQLEYYNNANHQGIAREIQGFLKNSPDEASRLIKFWLTDENETGKQN